MPNAQWLKSKPEVACPPPPEAGSGITGVWLARPKGRSVSVTYIVSLRVVIEVKVVVEVKAVRGGVIWIVFVDVTVVATGLLDTWVHRLP